MPRLVFSPRAEADLEEIGDYIARDDPARAISFLDELRAHCDHIAATPASYPAREDLAAGLRMAVHGRYLVLFRSDLDGVRIERIVHGARRLRGSI
ncbi:MAG TPA: type II toxin-antitoxin system RelE/ParE family toxin [Stellaceae bacterium]|nr:type II toxin-antitoxin system RelE/ParE family toxin [Stellaceae bacterium]